MFFLLDNSSTGSQPENLQVPTAIADLIHQERMKTLAGPVMNR